MIFVSKFPIFCDFCLLNICEHLFFSYFLILSQTLVRFICSVLPAISSAKHLFCSKSKKVVFDPVGSNTTFFVFHAVYSWYAPRLNRIHLDRSLGSTPRWGVVLPSSMGQSRHPSSSLRKIPLPPVREARRMG